MTKKTSAYVPALGYRWLTRLYDPLVRLLKEEKFKRLLVEQVATKPGHHVLDLGCGTATLTIMLAQACPKATIVGLDGDADVLAIARRKVAAAGLGIELHHGMAFAPPFEPESFDRVVSSLLFHHLTTADKRRTLAKVRALLRPGGELHIADWGQAQNSLMRVAFVGVQLLDGFETTADSVRGRLITLVQEAGFSPVSETHREMTLFGTLALYRAVTPSR